MDLYRLIPKHKPIELKDGKFMTERLISIDAPDGRTWAIPTVWFDQEGKHSQVSNTTALKLQRCTRMQQVLSFHVSIL